MNCLCSMNKFSWVCQFPLLYTIRRRKIIRPLQRWWMANQGWVPQSPCNWNRDEPKVSWTNPWGLPVTTLAILCAAYFLRYSFEGENHLSVCKNWLKKSKGNWSIHLDSLKEKKKKTAINAYHLVQCSVFQGQELLYFRIIFIMSPPPGMI